MIQFMFKELTALKACIDIDKLVWKEPCKKALSLLVSRIVLGFGRICGLSLGRTSSMPCSGPNLEKDLHLFGMRPC
jgi:hypothetical protein